MLRMTSISIRRPKPLPVGIGFLLVLGVILAEVVATIIVAKGGRPTGNPFVFFAWAVTFAYYLSCVFRFHKVMHEATRGHYSITPGKATYYHLFPVFNFYWLCRWPMQFAKFINHRRGISTIHGVPCGLGLVASAVTCLLFNPALGLAGLFLVLAYLTNHLEQFVAYLELNATAPGLEANPQRPARGRPMWLFGVPRDVAIASALFLAVFAMRMTLVKHDLRPDAFFLAGGLALIVLFFWIVLIILMYVALALSMFFPKRHVSEL